MAGAEGEHQSTTGLWDSWSFFWQHSSDWQDMLYAWMMTDYPRSSSTANCNKEPALVVATRNVSRTVWRPIWRSAILSRMNWKTRRQTDLGGAHSARTQCNSLKPIGFSVWKQRELSESPEIDAWQHRLWVRHLRAGMCVKDQDCTHTATQVICDQRSVERSTAQSTITSQHYVWYAGYYSKNWLTVAYFYCFFPLLVVFLMYAIPCTVVKLCDYNLRPRSHDHFISHFICIFFTFCNRIFYSTACEWVSSFLTAHQHKIGHPVPYIITYHVISFVKAPLICSTGAPQKSPRRRTDWCTCALSLP